MSEFRTLSGRVGTYSRDKGYGFLKSTEVGDVFLHISKVHEFNRAWTGELSGAMVTAEVERGDKGWKVKRVLSIAVN